MEEDFSHNASQQLGQASPPLSLTHPTFYNATRLIVFYQSQNERNVGVLSLTISGRFSGTSVLDRKRHTPEIENFTPRLGTRSSGIICGVIIGIRGAREACDGKCRGALLPLKLGTYSLLRKRKIQGC